MASAKSTHVSFEDISHLPLTPSGLSEDQVLAQRTRFGSNDIVHKKVHPWWIIVSETARDPMILLLFFAAAIFLVMGSYAEALGLFAASIPLIFMDVYLHRRTQASMEGLRDHLIALVRVRRGGREQEVRSTEVVPGDIVLLKSGELVPADGVLSAVTSLQVDESLLTGESLPVSKVASVLMAASVLDNSVVFAGCRVLRGEGELRVTSIGKGTRYGQIIESLAEIPNERTPLQKSIAKFVFILTSVSLVICVLLAAVRLYQGKGWVDAILSAAVLAVAAIPEEFPIVFSFFLGVGVFRLAQKKALVRRAVTVENMGRVQQICTDKTGTLTLGELKLIQTQTHNDLAESKLILFALIASDKTGEDPVDVALRNFYSSDQEEIPPRVQVFPFTEDRKKETAVIKDSSGRTLSAVKGAPEVIMQASTLTPQEVLLWRTKVGEWSERGQKVLACGYQYFDQDTLSSEPSAGFTFAGLMAFADPVREGVPGAIKYCQDNGIRILMLTGDHPKTAKAVARQIGLGGAEPVVFSAEEHPEEFTQEKLQSAHSILKKIDVAARCTPMQKLWIVAAFQKLGDIVAVTGDGVNDVLALQKADVGIAMGRRGSQAARDVAAIVLSDDNFLTLVSAIQEAQQLFQNLRQSFRYLLEVHIPLVLSAAIVPLLGFPILFQPLHLVWLELILHPSSLFAFQKLVRPEDLKKVKPQAQFFTLKETLIMTTEATAILVAVVYFYLQGIKEGKSEAHARANALAVLCFWSIALVIRGTRLQNNASRAVVAGTLASLVVFIQIPMFATFFHLSPLDLQDWVGAVAIVTGVVFLSRIFTGWRAHKD